MRRRGRERRRQEGSEKLAGSGGVAGLTAEEDEEGHVSGAAVICHTG